MHYKQFRARRFSPRLSNAFSLYLYFQTRRDGSEQLIWDHFVQAQGVEDGFQINSLRGFNWAVAVSEAVLRTPGLVVPDEVTIKRADAQVRRRVSMNWRELERKREIRLLPACRQHISHDPQLGKTAFSAAHAGQIAV